MEFLHPAIWHDHDIDFARWLHPAVWYVALELWQWIHQVAAPCNVIRGSEMTCYWIRPNIRHIGILHLNSISTTSTRLTCHSAPISEILSKSDHPRQKKMTSCRFSGWRISVILDFKDPIMGSLKSPCTTSYRSSIETIALNCLLFEKIAFFLHFGDRQTDKWTDEQMDSSDALSRSRYRERRLNNDRKRRRNQRTSLLEICRWWIHAWTCRVRREGFRCHAIQVALRGHYSRPRTMSYDIRETTEWHASGWCLTSKGKRTSTHSLQLCYVHHLLRRCVNHER